VVLAGGVSSEREVSLGSGLACAVALSQYLPTRLVDVTTAALPPGLDPERDVIFPTLHGDFGEDGGVQRLLTEAGLEFAGSEAESSELTFDKERTKEVARAEQVKVAAGCTFSGTAKPSAAELVAQLGEAVVLKPQCGGSSVGLSICPDEASLARALAEVEEGRWLAEACVRGREVTVGILGDRALPVVEIVPKAGVFDYEAKYTKGMTDYLTPAPLPEALAMALQEEALRLYRVCGCRDFARIDFMITPENDRILLEINTLPGMKETSLLPMGARCAGIDFSSLVREMIAPACDRLTRRTEGEVPS
jgi:D-alanine-D-alanine ligase